MYDVLVIGGGHAGIEAACVAARMGASVALVTMHYNNIGVMSCNPAIGGVGKGTLVREIDALDGVMAKAADKAGIHYKVLNQSKGPAVHGPRVQADRRLYKQAVQSIVSAQQNLNICQDTIQDIKVTSNSSFQIIGEHEQYKSKSIVLTSGTFLNGLTHMGKDRKSAGRYGEQACNKLSKMLDSHNVRLGRLKTGTPPRICKDTVNWNKCTIQLGDEDMKPLSYMTNSIDVPQLNCYITRTSVHTKQIIQNNIHHSPLYSGQIGSKGPRYCPSIEDKIVRFADKDTHQVFLEPEGLDSNLIYPNGISTSLPKKVQEQLVHSIAGLEDAKISQYGYAIEYDHVDPTELSYGLELYKIPGLFLAGQINGTTGYEEAAGQGIVAGINAVLKACNKKPAIFPRSQSLIGVMIDDLVTQGVTEPYRMFTSRSEYRLHIRSDNADLRLTDLGIKLGCVSDERKLFHVKQSNEVQQLFNLMKETVFTPNELEKFNVAIKKDGKKRNLFELLSFPNIDIDVLKSICPSIYGFSGRAYQHVLIESIYYGHLDKQSKNIALYDKEFEMSLPVSIDYSSINGLSNEMKEKMLQHRPPNIAIASKIPGVTPSAIVALISYVKKHAT